MPMIVLASASSPLSAFSRASSNGHHSTWNTSSASARPAASCRPVARYRWITSVKHPGELKYAPSGSQWLAEVRCFFDQLAPRGGFGRLVGLEFPGRQLVDVSAGGVPELPQQANAILRIDGHHGGAAWMTHDLQRNAQPVGQLHLIHAHLDHPPGEDFLGLDQHGGECTCLAPRTARGASQHRDQIGSQTAADSLLAAIDAWLQQAGSRAVRAQSARS